MIFSGCSDLVHFFQHFYPALNLGGLGILISKPLDEPFCVLDLFLLVLIGIAMLLQPQGLIFFILGVISVIQGDLFQIDFKNMVYGPV